MLKTLITTLTAAALITNALAESPRPRGVASFDERWMAVTPRVEDTPYPNLPADWEPLPNPRYEVPTGFPLQGVRICVDAGHGGQVFGSANGYTAGTRGVNTGLLEEEVNLRTAYFLWDLLTQAGAEVVMTRVRPDRITDPCTSPPGSPEWIANRREELHRRPVIAEAEGCDYFVAVHHNAPREPASELNYTSVYYFDTRLYNEEYNEDPAYVNRYHDEELNAERISMAQKTQAALSRHMGLREINLPDEWWDADFGEGVPHGDFHVIREIGIPAILLECSFMTNAEEDLLLNDPARCRQEALAVFEGLMAHFEENPPQKWSERAPAGTSVD